MNHLVWSCLVLSATALGHSTPQRYLSEAESQAVCERYYKNISEAQTIHWFEIHRHEMEVLRSECWLVRPNHYRSDSVVTNSKGAIVDRGFMVMSQTIAYMVDQTGKTFSLFDRAPGSPFINGMEAFLSKSKPKYFSMSKVREATFKGAKVYALETGEQSLPGSMVSVYISPSTYLPLGWEYAFRGRTEFTTYSDIRLNESPTSVNFDWNPPKDYKLKSDLRRATLRSKFKD